MYVLNDTRTPSTLQLTKTFGSKCPASYFKLLLRVDLE